MLKQEIIDWLSKMNIKNYSLRDNLVDVDGNVNLYDRNLEVIPVQFGIVKGHFSCSGNNLKSLEGIPQTVGGHFYCSKNNLKSLEGCPQTVGGHFWCWYNNLKSLEGSPKTVGGNFNCSRNNLESLKYLPDIKGELFCDDHLKESEEYHRWSFIFKMNKRHA